MAAMTGKISWSPRFTRFCDGKLSATASSLRLVIKLLILIPTPNGIWLANLGRRICWRKLGWRVQVMKLLNTSMLPHRISIFLLSKTPRRLVAGGSGTSLSPPMKPARDLDDEISSSLSEELSPTRNGLLISWAPSRLPASILIIIDLMSRFVNLTHESKSLNIFQFHFLPSFNTIYISTQRPSKELLKYQ